MRIKVTTLTYSAICRLVDLFPDSKGKLDADDVMDAIQGHNTGSIIDQEIATMVQKLIDNNTPKFVIP